MARLWLTYAWVDNEQNDVDYIVQELSTRGGLEVHLDRYSLRAGQGIWAQIADHITNPEQSDAWAIYATENSLRSKPCQEELAYALGRALRSRSEDFPLIGIFPVAIDPGLVPPAIGTRLWVALDDEHWIERVKAEAERRAPRIAQPPISNVFSRVHSVGGDFVVEVRPRVGRWYPFVVRLPATEADRYYRVAVGPANDPPMGMSNMRIQGGGDDRWMVLMVRNEVTPHHSAYVTFSQLPSELYIGPPDEPHQIPL